MLLSYFVRKVFYSLNYWI